MALAGARLAGWDITLLDEPTNNLDARSRARVHDADADLSRAKTRARAELEREQQRNRSGQREWACGNVSKGAANFFANPTEKNSGSKSDLPAAALDRAGGVRADADAAAGTTDPIRIDLPGITVPTGKRVLAFEANGVHLDLTGPERIRLAVTTGRASRRCSRGHSAACQRGRPAATRRPCSVARGSSRR